MLFNSKSLSLFRQDPDVIKWNAITPQHSQSPFFALSRRSSRPTDPCAWGTCMRRKFWRRYHQVHTVYLSGIPGLRVFNTNTVFMLRVHTLLCTNKHICTRNQACKTLTKITHSLTHDLIRRAVTVGVGGAWLSFLLRVACWCAGWVWRTGRQRLSFGVMDWLVHDFCVFVRAWMWYFSVRMCAFLHIVRWQLFSWGIILP